MLKEHGVDFDYREYVREPLSESELQALFEKLGVSPKELLRPRDRNARTLTGSESDGELVKLMSAHPTLLQRPIAVLGKRAVVGRPAERILELLE